MTTTHARAANEYATALLGTPEGQAIHAHATSWARDPANAVLRNIYGQPYQGWTIGQIAAARGRDGREPARRFR